VKYVENDHQFVYLLLNNQVVDQLMIVLHVLMFLLNQLVHLLMVLYQEMELTSLNLLEQLIDVLYMNFYKKKQEMI
jgi:hypothetical protein